MSTPAKYSFQLYQGQTWRNVLALKDAASLPVPLVGYTARLHIRGEIGDETPILTLTTENGRLVIDGVAGTVTINVTAADMTALDLNFEVQNWVYDLELISDDDPAVVTRVMEGGVSVSPEVTR